MQANIRLRIDEEVNRIALHSDRASEKHLWVESRIKHFAKYRDHGSPSRIDKALRSMLCRAAVGLTSYQGDRLNDFIQDFLVECLQVFRREFNLLDYSPETADELAEFAAFSERYARRKVNGHQILRHRVLRKIEQIPKDYEFDQDFEDNDGTFGGCVVAAPTEHLNHGDALIQSFVDFLASRQQQDCIDYLRLKLSDASAATIDRALGLTAEQRDNLQQRFFFQTKRFIGTAGDEYHDYFDLGFHNCFGLSPSQWAIVTANVSPQVIQIKRQGTPLKGNNQREWCKALLKAKEVRCA